MQRDVSDKVGQSLHNPCRPVSPRHPDGDEPKIGVDPAHEPAVLAGVVDVLLDRAVPHLPRPVHLVPQTPGVHPERFGQSVALPEPGEGRVARVVALLDPADGVVDAAQVVTQEGPGADRFAPREELGGAETVALLRTPREFETTWA